MSHSTTAAFRNGLRRLFALTLAFVALFGVGLVAQNVFPPATGGGGGGGGTWGSITGTLSSQTDLNTALNGKAGTGAANNYTAGAKQSFVPSGTNAGVNVGAAASAPSSPVTGDIYFNSTLGRTCTYDGAAWRCELYAPAAGTGFVKWNGTALSAASLPMPITYEAGVCQGASPAMAFSFKTGTGATALCADEGGANGAVTGVAAFDVVNEQVQGRFTLPSDFDAAGTVRLDIYYRAVPTSGNVTWRLDNAVVVDGATSGTIDFSSGNQNTAAASTVQGTTLRRSTVTVSSLTTTNWAANAQVYWRLVLTTWTGTALSTSNTVQVVAVRFTVPRA